MGKGSRFPSPILKKGSIGSSVQYWVKVLSVLKSNIGKSSRFPVQYWERLYRFISPVLGKGSIGFPVKYWKRFCRFPSPDLGKGSMCSQDQY